MKDGSVSALKEWPLFRSQSMCLTDGDRSSVGDELTPRGCLLVRKAAPLAQYSCRHTVWLIGTADEVSSHGVRCKC